ncbi:MAG: alpha-amylase family protein, partial [Candidatus Acidiferrum sp.]
MKINRRDFMALSAAAAAATTWPDPIRPPDSEEPGGPWHQKIRRVGQLNMTEHDPAVMNVEEWADYWASLKVDAVLVSVTGILAFYPTEVPYHRKGKFLNNRDFFGECCSAAKKRNLHVVARLSPDLNWGDALEAHPEWFKRDPQGDPLKHDEDSRLYQTCMFTSYFTDYIPTIMREVNSRYDVDGIFTNAWPPIGRMPVCFCNKCKHLPTSGTPAYWDEFNARVVYLWRLYESIAKEKRAENIFFANMGGAIKCGPNMKELEGLCHWFNCDNQGRGGEGAPVWGCSLQGRVCHAIMKGRTSTNVTAAWSTGNPRWRNIAKSPNEARMWLNETVASGMVPWYHFIGAEDGLGADRRWQEPGREYFDWLARHDQHFKNKRSIANIAVVMGQRTQWFYQSLGDAAGQEDANQHIQGLYYALLEGRFLFDFVHEDDLAAENLKKYRALLLPNIALLSDHQCQQLRDYVNAGGSVLASFETGMFTERNERRPDFGLSDVFGIHSVGAPKTTNGNGFLARIERKHEILDGFSNVDWLPGAKYLLPIAPVENPLLTVVPAYVAYPPELSYPPVPRTNDPAIVLREKGDSRLVYFPSDIERTMWRSGNTDLSRLIQNSVRWVTRGDTPVRVQGDGMIETFAWETDTGYTVHILNYTNPNTHKGWIREFYPIGEQRVKMTLHVGKKISRVELLRAEKDIPFSQRGDTVEFMIPSVLDYE